MAEQYSIYHIFFIHLSVDGQLGCSHVLAIIYNAAMNTGVHVPFQINVFIFFRSYSSSIFSFFEEPPYCFPQWLNQSTFPPRVYEGSLFSTSLPTFVICGLFTDRHSDRCKVTSHCGFDLHFSDDQQCRARFHVPVSHLHVFFGKMFIQVCCPFINQGFFFDIYKLFIYVGSQPLISHIICKYFLPFSRLSSCFVEDFLCWAKAFKFNQVSFVHFCFCFLCLRRQIQKNIATIHVKECSTYVFFQEFYVFQPYIQVFNPF